MTAHLIDLSHDLADGTVTYPGFPPLSVKTHLTRDQAEDLYGSGVTFHIGLVTICTNTGTYVDVPFHRFPDGYDLTALPLHRVADVPGLVISRPGERSIDLTPADLGGSAGHAVLVRTNHSRLFGTAEYAQAHPHLTAQSAEALVSAGVACVGIDSLNIDSTDDMSRPVHTTLLGAGIPVVEHLTNLGALPRSGFRFSAVPPKIAGAGTFTVRAYASIPTSSGTSSA